METNFLTVLIIMASVHLVAQTDEEAVHNTLQDYIVGTSFNKPEMIKGAFYENATLYLSKKDQEIFILTAVEYADSFKKREWGEINGREGKVLSVNVENDIAMAKAEILIPDASLRFIDIFLLKKLGGKWKIISKAATLMPEE